jgi:type IV pilus biogenesis protein CpaD/CtpE
VRDRNRPLSSGRRHPGDAAGTLSALLPGCPGWSDHVSAPEDNRPNPNFGCSDVSNLAAMVGDPHHLREGASSIYSDGEVAATGVTEYRADKVKDLPKTNEEFSVIPRAQ